jgi:hypothetical protein
MEKGKSFSLSFSLQREGADLDDPTKVESINISWALTLRAVRETLPLSIRELYKGTPQKQNADNFSGRMMTLEMASSRDLTPYERAWLESAKAAGRKDIHDIGVRLTPKEGLRDVEGGYELIEELQAEGWKPVSFMISEKSSTEQRKVSREESLKKIFFTLSFERESSQKPAIEIPESVLIVLARQSTWRFSHIWYNPVILHSINFNLVSVWWNPDPAKRLPKKWVVTL